MRIHLHITQALVLAASLFLANADISSAQPFSASSTYRKSIRRDVNGNVYPLTQDSRDLVFQDYPYIDPTGKLSYDPRYLAFGSKDAAVDDLPKPIPTPTDPGRCTADGYYQVYWVDDYNNSVRCVSVDAFSRTQGNNDSFNPRIGGPTDDEGRYVAFETRAKNLWLGKDPQITPTPTPTPVGSPIFTTPAPTYTPLTEVAVHDRKFEQTWLSTSKNKPECRIGANESMSLAGLSDDGSKILFSSAATNLVNNLEPQCRMVGFPGQNVYLRNGSQCDDSSETVLGLGECYTSVLYDSYGLHAGPGVKTGLDDDSYNPAMSVDSSIIVFDSRATVPTHFNPDISGYFDIYYWKGNRFSVISRAQVPRCSISGALLPIQNDNEPADGNSRKPRVDQTGRYVVYESTATDLVVDQTNPNMVCSDSTQTYYPHPKSVSYLANNDHSQIYLYDSVRRTTQMISRAYNSNQGANGDSTNAWISRDNHYVVFESVATNLLSSATTARKNIFMYDRILNRTYIVTPGTGGTGLSADATITHVSNNGLVVAFQTLASDAVPNNASNGTLTLPNTVQHVYLAQNSCPLDGDGDGVPDCLDLCKTDPAKSSPGECGCGKSDGDSDRDLVPDCLDKCRNAPDIDKDNDGVPDCVDGCPNDVNKTAPLSCGCGLPETDSDQDGVADCKDQCPSNPKSVPGICGCAVPETDANGNGAPDCIDPTASTQPSAPQFDLTRTSLSRQRPKYQLFGLLQRFSGRVTYNVTVSKRGFKKSRSSSSRSVVLRDIPKGTYTLTYTVSVGSGSSKVTSRAASATVRVPGGIPR
jgi:hypothetical protein